jgi:molecular chaperone DnaK (HSP70)
MLVFDFGGGTLDLSLLEVEGQTFTVKAVSGNTHLGGRDFDEVLMQLCLERFDRSGQTTIESLDKGKCHELRMACQEAKCNLSESEKTEVYLDNFHKGKVLEVNITRLDLEAKCQGLLDQILEPIEDVLDQTQRNPRDIDDILLIGGSSSIPAVKRKITAFFGKVPLQGVSPLEAVTKGATIIAGQIKGGCGMSIIRDLAVHDICAVPIGVGVAAARMWVIIPAGSQLPAEGTSRFVTAFPNQKVVPFDVLEGSWLMTKRNRRLGSFTIRGIPPAEAREESVSVTFGLSHDRILTVTAVVLSQGTTTHLEVQKVGCLFGAEETRRSPAERRRERALDRQEYDESDRRTALAELVKNLGTFFEEEPGRNAQFRGKISQSTQNELLRLVRSKLPSNPGGAPSRDDVQNAYDRVQDRLGSYFVEHRGGIPKWLKCYSQAEALRDSDPPCKSKHFEDEERLLHGTRTGRVSARRTSGRLSAGLKHNTWE